LNRPESYLGIAGKLTEIERFSDMAVQDGEYGPSGAPEQCVR